MTSAGEFASFVVQQERQRLEEEKQAQEDDKKSRRSGAKATRPSTADAGDASAKKPKRGEASQVTSKKRGATDDLVHPAYKKRVRGPVPERQCAKCRCELDPRCVDSCATVCGKCD